MQLPLFPLRSVLCPGIALPLHIFEDRYRQMIGRCLERSEPFGVVLIEDGNEVGSPPRRVAEVGTTALIRQAGRYPDGRMDIVTVGQQRFRLDEVHTGAEPWLVGTVSVLDEPVGCAEREAERVAKQVGSVFLRYLRLLQPTSDDGQASDDELPDLDDPAADIETSQVTDQLSDRQRGELLMASARRLVVSSDATAVSYLLTGLVQVPLTTRQELLELPDTLSRLRRLHTLLQREIALLSDQLRPIMIDQRLGSQLRN
jgi:Lon protease-like protein